MKAVVVEENQSYPWVWGDSVEGHPLVTEVRCVAREGLGLAEGALAGVAFRGEVKMFFLAFVWPTVSSVQEFRCVTRCACF